MSSYFWHGRDNTTTRELNPKVPLYTIIVKSMNIMEKALYFLVRFSVRCGIIWRVLEWWLLCF